MKKYLKLTFVLLLCFQINAQENTRFQRQQITVENNNSQTLKFKDEISSIYFNLSENQLVGKIFVSTEDEVFQIKPDADNPAQSALIVFSKPVQSLKILAKSFSGKLTMNSIYVKPSSLPNIHVEKSSRVGADCEKPTVIPASVWRSGLTPPKELPVKTTTKHVIVHHAAGSNTNTNYTDVVRNIYTFHTQSNGWNDVGYNFLIAQDGTIYEGRDGQNIIDGDNVLGAHFCSQNSGTMGICLLGDYMTAQPTDISLESLAKLIAWKAKKEAIMPLEKSIHAASGKNLNNISAHRDGSCSTDCPGDNLYAKLEQVRQKTVQSCTAFTPLGFVDELDLLPQIYPNPTSGKVWINVPTSKTEILVFDGMGIIRMTEKQFQKEQNRYSFSTEGLAKGIYFIKIGEKTAKILVE
jgi:N-acetylmuramoyl-L-alanine amidase/Secretion system C-terminal sorting domain